jgi:hypothetical protein
MPYGRKSGLTSRELPISNYVGRITLLTGLVLVVRYIAENVVLRLYPERSVITDCGEPDEAPKVQQIASVLARALMFVWIATAFYPLSWKVVFGAGTLAFSIIVYVQWIAEKTPNIAVLHRIVPGEVTFMALLLLACDFVTRKLPSWEQNPERQLLMGIVYYGIPTIILSALVLFSREGKRPEFKQWHYAFGIPMVAVLSKVMFFY